MTRCRRRAAIGLALLSSLSAAVAANLWALRVAPRFDFTQHAVYSLGSETLAVLAALDEPVRITFFYDLRNQAHLDARALLRRYSARSRWITTHSADPDLDPGLARALGVRFAGETVFQGAGAPVVMRGAGEEVFTNGLLRATQAAGRNLCFSEGHGESDPASLSSHDHFEAAVDPGHDHQGGGHTHGGEPHRIVERHGMGLAREALETLGYRVDRRALGRGPDALSGCTTVIVASPITRFETREVQTLRSFSDGGGALLLLLEPGVETGLQPLLADFGISFDAESVRDPTRHYWTDPRTPAVSRYPRHRITRGVGLSFFPGVAAVQPTPGGVPEDVVATPLVETSDDATRIANPGEPGVQTLMVYAVRTRGRGTERERVSRLAVVGDGDFATNSFFPILGNRDLFLNTIHTLTEVERLLGVAPRGYAPPRLELTARQMQLSFVISTLLLPALLFAAGGWVWWRLR